VLSLAMFVYISSHWLSSQCTRCDWLVDTGVPVGRQKAQAQQNFELLDLG